MLIATGDTCSVALFDHWQEVDAAGVPAPVSAVCQSSGPDIPMDPGRFCHAPEPSGDLLLWDRIIGFDSLLPLPVLAVAVMSFR